MPTDPNNLKDGQVIAVLVKADVCEHSNPNYLVKVCSATGISFLVSRVDILTDWPPEPIADEAGWEDVKPNHKFAKEYTYEYRIQCRPIAPKWVPTVGEPAMWDGVKVNVTATDGGRAVIMREYVVGVDSLTQPKDQPHDQD